MLVENEMATHYSILPWRIPWTEAPVHGVAKELDMTEQLNNNRMLEKGEKKTVTGSLKKR